MTGVRFFVAATRRGLDRGAPTLHSLPMDTLNQVPFRLGIPPQHFLKHGLFIESLPRTFRLQIEAA